MSGMLDGYDAALLDLDGTVVRGSDPVPGAPDVVNALRDSAIAIQFITNNASRSPEQVAHHLREVGIDADPREVLTSGQAAVAVLSEELPAGTTVLVVGTPALVDAVEQAGLRAVRTADEQPVAVLQGHSPETGWAQLAEACIAIREGALWVACNIDRTLPTERGLLPGNGAMVAALTAATDRAPTVTGKPRRPLVDTAVRRIGAQRPLIVGDRLDTDIAGARAAQLDSMLVLSGVADAAALLAAPPEQRPVYVAADVRALCGSLEATRVVARDAWRAGVEGDTGDSGDSGDTVVLRRGTTAGSEHDPLDALRAVCAAWWERGSGAVRLRAGDDSAAKALDALGLDALPA